jgi:WD40 repeat protein
MPTARPCHCGRSRGWSAIWTLFARWLFQRTAEHWHRPQTTTQCACGQLTSPIEHSFCLNANASDILTDLDVSPDEKWLAAADDKGGLHLWSIGTAVHETLPGQSSAELGAIAWSPQDALLAGGDVEGRVTVHHLPPGGASYGFGVQGEVSALRWFPDGSGILTSGGLDGTIDAHSIQGAQLPKFEKGHEDAVLGLAVSPDGNSLISADALGQIRRWDIATRTPLGAPRNARISRDTVAFSQDAGRFLVAGTDGDVLVFRFDGDDKPISCHSGSQQLDAAAFGFDDKLVAAVSRDAVLHLWTLARACDILASAPLPLFADAPRQSGPHRMDYGVDSADTAAMGVRTRPPDLPSMPSGKLPTLQRAPKRRPSSNAGMSNWPPAGTCCGRRRSGPR